MTFQLSSNRQLYDGPYTGMVKKNNMGEFECFECYIGDSHKRNGYWCFPSAHEVRAYQAGFKSPEAILKCQLEEDDSPDDIILRWIPGLLDTYHKPRDGNAKQHLMGIADERQRLGRPGLHGSFTIPTYPIDVQGLLLGYRAVKDGSSARVPEPDSEVRSKRAKSNVMMPMMTSSASRKASTSTKRKLDDIPKSFLNQFSIVPHDANISSSVGDHSTAASRKAPQSPLASSPDSPFSTTNKQKPTPSKVEPKSLGFRAPRRGQPISPTEQQPQANAGTTTGHLPSHGVVFSMHPPHNEKNGGYRSPYSSKPASPRENPIFAQDGRAEGEPDKNRYIVRRPSRLDASTSLFVDEDTILDTPIVHETVATDGLDQDKGRSQFPHIDQLPPLPLRKNLDEPDPVMKQLAAKTKGMPDEMFLPRQKPQPVVIPPASVNGKPFLSPKPPGWYADSLPPPPPRNLKPNTSSSQAIEHAPQKQKAITETATESGRAMLTNELSSAAQPPIQSLQDGGNQGVSGGSDQNSGSVYAYMKSDITPEKIEAANEVESNLLKFDSSDHETNISSSADNSLGSPLVHDFESYIDPSITSKKSTQGLQTGSTFDLPGTPVSLQDTTAAQGLQAENSIDLPDTPASLQDTTTDSIGDPLSGPIACIDCGLDEGHKYDCHIGNIKPLENPNILQLRWIADEVERRDPEQWREHRDPPRTPTPELEDTATKIKDMIEIVRNDDTYKNDPSLHGIPDDTLLFAWAFRQSKTTKCEIIYYDEEGPYTIETPPSSEDGENEKSGDAEKEKSEGAGKGKSEEAEEEKIEEAEKENIKEAEKENSEEAGKEKSEEAEKKKSEEAEKKKSEEAEKEKSEEAPVLPDAA